MTTVYRQEHCLNCGLPLEHLKGRRRQFCDRACAMAYHAAESKPKFPIALSAYDVGQNGVQRRSQGAGMFVELKLVDDSLDISDKLN